jgi:hypothetical protein
MITTFTFGMKCPRRRFLKAPTAAMTMVVATTVATTVETMAMTTRSVHPMCCAACRHSIEDLYASVDKCLQAMEAMK